MKYNNSGTGVKNTHKSKEREAKWPLIDKRVFEGLCALQCTKKDIAGVFRVTEYTIDRFCEYTYGMKFKEAFERFSADGRVSLRLALFRNATEHNNVIAQIFENKNYNGMTDKVEQVNTSRIVFSNDVPDSDDEE